MNDTVESVDNLLYLLMFIDSSFQSQVNCKEATGVTQGHTSSGTGYSMHMGTAWTISSLFLCWLVYPVVATPRLPGPQVLSATIIQSSMSMESSTSIHSSTSIDSSTSIHSLMGIVNEH